MNSSINESGSRSVSKGTHDGEEPIAPADLRVISQPAHTEITTSQDGTTKFTGIGMSTVTDITMPSPSVTIVPQYDDIKSFLAKPYLVNSGNWTSSSTAGVLLVSNTSIGANLNNVAQWANKLQGFLYIRAKAKFRLVINANPMQQGKLKLGWWPLLSADSGASRLNTLASISMLPGVEIDCADTQAILNIPYVGPFEYLSLKSNDYDFGGYFLVVMSPLLTGASGETSVSYSLYLSWEEVELIAPAVPQSGKAFKKPGPSKLSSERSASAMDRMFESAGTLTTSVLKGLAAPFVSSAPWVEPLINGVAQIFGFSKPPTSTLPMLVSQLKAPFMANSSGVSTSVQLGLRHDNMLDIPDLSVNGLDEMSFDFVKQVPCLINTFSLNVTDTLGNSNYSVNVNPQLQGNACYFATSYLTHNIDIGFMCPAGYLSRYFRYWRGSMRITLKIIKTRFHTGRYQLTWTPYWGSTTAPTPYTGVLAIREIIDLSGPDEIVLDLPYMLPFQWIDFQSNNIWSGRLDIVCLNPLRAPEVCSGIVSVLVYLSGGCDFELGGINCASERGGTFANNPMPAMIAQSGNLTERSSEPITDGIVANIGSCDSDMFQPQRSSIGEVFTHLRQLTNKYANVLWNTQSYNHTTLSTDASGQAYFNPFFVISSLPSFTGTAGYSFPVGVSIISEIVAGYAYYRGSINSVIGVDPQAAADATVYRNLISTSLACINNSAAPSAGLGTSTGTNNNNTITSLDAGGIVITNVPRFFNESTQFHNANVGLAEVRVPYYNKYRLAPTNTFSANYYGPTYGLDVRVFGAKTSADLQVGLAGGEDFLLTLFIGFPGVVVSTA